MVCLICSIVAILIAAYGAFKIYMKATTGWCYSYTCLVGKTAIVTGANTGIGYYTALDFAKRGCRVILACRSKDKAEEAKNKIIKATGNQNVVVKLIDMESLDSVKQFAKDFNETEERLDILVNNAGGAGWGDKFTNDKLQITLHVNHFSNVLLTDLLLEKLKKSTPSRIVNTSSTAASFSKLTIDDFNKYPASKMADIELYNDSKLCNIFFTLELAKRLEGTGVTVNVLHPGAVSTEFARNMPAMFYKIWKLVTNGIFKSSEEGAQTTIYVSVAKEEEGVNGKLYADCKQIPLYKSAKNPVLSEAIWHKSRQLVGLTHWPSKL